MKSAGGEQTRRKKKRRRVSPFLFSLASARFDVFPPFLLIIMVGFLSTFYPVSFSSLID